MVRLPLSSLVPTISTLRRSRESRYSAAMMPSSSGASENPALPLGGALLSVGRLSASTGTASWPRANSALTSSRPSGPTT